MAEETANETLENLTENRSINKYNLDDTSHEFKVFIQKNGVGQESKTISALKIAEIIDKITKGKHINEIKRVSKKRVIVVCTKAEAANDLVENQEIKINGFIAFIPLFLTSRAAIIKGVDLEYSVESIEEAIDTKQFRIKSLTRLTRRETQDGKLVFLPTPTIKILFEGQHIPSYVYLWKLRFECFPFIRRIKQCFKCLRYGHIAGNCNSKDSRCIKCGSTEHSSDSCTRDKVVCVNCSLNHDALHKTCPERKRQIDINELMANQNISFQEATLEIPRAQELINTYAVRTRNRFEVFNRMQEEFSNLETRKSKVNLPTYRPPPISKFGRRKIPVPIPEIKNLQESSKRLRRDTSTSSDLDLNQERNSERSSLVSKQRKVESDSDSEDTMQKGISVTVAQIHEPKSNINSQEDMGVIDKRTEIYEAVTVESDGSEKLIGYRKRKEKQHTRGYNVISGSEETRRKGRYSLRDKSK